MVYEYNLLFNVSIERILRSKTKYNYSSALWVFIRSEQTRNACVIYPPPRSYRLKCITFIFVVNIFNTPIYISPNDFIVQPRYFQWLENLERILPVLFRSRKAKNYCLLFFGTNAWWPVKLSSTHILYAYIILCQRELEIDISNKKKKIIVPLCSYITWTPCRCYF